ncbi:MAG: aldehyde dehydrogenase family protein [Bacillaceae bacterium]
MKKEFYIGGKWQQGEEYSDLYAPFSGEKLAEIPQASMGDVNEAIECAHEAFFVTSKMPAHERARLLHKLADLFEERREELATILALEAGKPMKAALGEISRTSATYRFAAEEAKRIYGETLPLDAAPGGEGRLAYTLRKPIGVIGAITPFNFPSNLVAHKVGPAFAAGNTIVLKPASQTPLSAYALASLWEEAGFPKGSLNVVTGKGSIVGEALVKDERIAGLTFTGSPRVGIGMKNKAGLKKVTLELGSNAAAIIDKHADLTDEVIDRCVWGAFVYNGQVCISLQRIYVHESLYENFLSRFVQVVAKLKVGDPLDHTTDITALIAPSEVKRMDEWVQEAVSLGANVECGGYKVNDRIYAPTVLTNVKHHANVSCQEVFGPIVLVTPYQELDDAISYVNDSKYGLQASIFTKNIDVAMKTAEALEVGGVMINEVPTFRVDHMPYGGVKQSGFGREGIKYAIQEMTELKLVSIKL